MRLPAIVNEEWLWELDVLRLDCPRDVVAVLDIAAAVAEDALLPLLYAVYGAALRQLERLADARWSYDYGQQFAEEDFADDLVALIIQRRAWIDAADGDLTKAISRVRCAAGIFTELGDQKSLGKTLVDRGILFYHMERFRHSSACMEKALPLLDEFDFEYRFAANHGCAVNAQAQGDARLALKWMEKAQMDLPYCSEQAKECYRWLKAKLLVEAGEVLVGAKEYAKISEFGMRTGNLLDAALAKAEEAQTLLAAGFLNEATQVAERLNWFVFRLNSKTAQAALIDLRNTASKGGLASGLLATTQTLSQLRKPMSQNPPKSG